MLSSDVLDSAAAPAKLANLADLSEIDAVQEASLDRAIEAMEEEANQYQQAGLTHVSTWLD